MKITIVGRLFQYLKVIKFDHNGKNGKIRLAHPLGLLFILFCIVIIPAGCLIRNESIIASYSQMIDSVCIL
jgi:hypothetical protein